MRQQEQSHFRLVAGKRITHSSLRILQRSRRNVICRLSTRLEHAREVLLVLYDLLVPLLYRFEMIDQRVGQQGLKRAPAHPRSRLR